MTTRAHYHHHRHHHRHHHHTSKHHHHHIHQHYHPEIRNERNKSSLHLLSSAVSIPHPEKAPYGEDAFFTTNDALAVFDGVGSWTTVGVNVADFSKSLSQNIRSEVHTPLPLSQIVRNALRRISVQGSSTLCVARLQDRRLSGINVGDSRLAVFRKGHCVFRTRMQQHAWNFPHQVSAANLEDLNAAELFAVDIVEGDIVIVASDGFWDNVFKHDIQNTIGKHVRSWRVGDTGCESSVQFNGNVVHFAVMDDRLGKRKGVVDACINELALDLAKQACANANSSHVPTPFAEGSCKAGVKFSGGKLDDITVVAAVAVSSPIAYRSAIIARCPQRSKSKRYHN